MKNLAVFCLICLFPYSGHAQNSGAAHSRKAQPLVFGETMTVPSRELDENRVINIYLPPGYKANDTITYPVIYIIDGGVDEDFFHIAGIVRYNNQPWINRFPPSIVVGIENTDRRRDCSFAVTNLDFLDRVGFSKSAFPNYGGSARYIAFVEKELIPFMAEKYKARQGGTIIGESFAGLLATEILLHHRKLFDNYIIISPGLWWGDEALLKEAPALLEIASGQKTKVYIAAANKDEDKLMYDEAVALQDILKKYGGRDMDVFYDYLSDELHSTIIHQAVYNAFKMFYPHSEFQH